MADRLLLVTSVLNRDSVEAHGLHTSGGFWWVPARIPLEHPTLIERLRD